MAPKKPVAKKAAPKKAPAAKANTKAKVTKPAPTSKFMVLFTPDNIC